MTFQYDTETKHLTARARVGSWSFSLGTDLTKRLLQDAKGVESMSLEMMGGESASLDEMKKLVKAMTKCKLKRVQLKNSKESEAIVFFKHFRGSQMTELVFHCRSFEGVELTTKIEKFIGRHKKTLAKVDLRWSNGYGQLGRILHSMKECPLDSLILRGMPLDAVQVEEDAAMKPYEFEGEDEARALVNLLNTKPVTEFGLDQVDFANSSTKTIISGILNCKTIKVLHLGPVSEGGTRGKIGSICSKLPEMSSVTKLVWTGPTTRALIDGLEASESFEWLQLKGPLEASCVERIATVLKAHQKICRVEIGLRSLWRLKKQKAVSSAVTSLAGALVTNPTLDHLSLVPVRGSAAAAFAARIPEMTGLRSLRFGVESHYHLNTFSPLVTALQQNQSIHEVKIAMKSGEAPDSKVTGFQDTINREVGTHMQRNAANPFLCDVALPTSVWPFVLAKFVKKKWTDTLWYTLQQKPDLMIHAGHQQQAGRKRSHDNMLEEKDGEE